MSLKQHLNFFQIFLQGHMGLNRSVQGDKVVVEILPEEEWTCPSSMMMEETETTEEKRGEDAEKEVNTIQEEGFWWCKLLVSSK